jgi:hypothetical protein
MLWCEWNGPGLVKMFRFTCCMNCKLFTTLGPLMQWILLRNKWCFHIGITTIFIYCGFDDLMIVFYLRKLWWIHISVTNTIVSPDTKISINILMWCSGKYQYRNSGSENWCRNWMQYAGDDFKLFVLFFHNFVDKL